ncbi:hypothetical protein [Halorubellus litoreus]|uniref:Uncharacterized protein n=1 Tax=Halorubellus litoreus TaxID=755308 RepID=A0ABD5VHS7_9EURY
MNEDTNLFVWQWLTASVRHTETGTRHDVGPLIRADFEALVADVDG